MKHGNWGGGEAAEGNAKRGVATCAIRSHIDCHFIQREITLPTLFLTQEVLADDPKERTVGPLRASICLGML